MSEDVTRSASEKVVDNDPEGTHSSPTLNTNGKKNVEAFKWTPKPTDRQPCTSTEKTAAVTPQKESFDLFDLKISSPKDEFSEVHSSDPISKDNTNTILNSHKLKFYQENEFVSSEEGHLNLKPGEELNKYKILKRLGVGSYSAVWLAEDTANGSGVALKIEKLLASGKSCNANELKIAKLITSVIRSDGVAGDNIVSFLDKFTVKGNHHAEHLVLVYEVCGPDLFTIIENSNQRILSFKRIQDIGRQLLTGLIFLHSKCHVLHCDLKPENIMIAAMDKDAQVEFEAPGQQFSRGSFNVDLISKKCNVVVKIGDFGLGMQSDSTKAMLVQTCIYRAPENHLNAEITTAIDMWSFGCIMYYLTTRQDLFVCDDKCGAVVEEAQTHLTKIFGLLGEPDLGMYRGRSKFPEVNKLVESGKLFTPGVQPAPICLMKNMKQFSSMTAESVALLSDLLLQILQLDPKARLSAENALKHPFFTHEETDGLSEEKLRELNQKCYNAVMPSDSGSPHNLNKG
ncbi:hypothetical protein CAEBREN_15712 [Caenorhabditis brenneri]|uniref:Protein kinase domain-containing protein n=1 Tax=Caenorhabditis brenneri TaxID=135651 RepID=G0NKT7_CAEBE|nr:hypothetical protein CAEBREN_15712 [Caenorhabditis brenneri]